ncbi:MAG: hypothetical protein GXY48_06295 [Methanomicrobiales archaeon]|nr:hypothetical protein [Methanomicrobiales archaeon]
MSPTDDEVKARRIKWRELCRSHTEHDILYYISSYPDGVRETKIKTYMQDVFKYSFQGSIETHLKKLEVDGLISKERTRSGAAIWHANQSLVIEMVEKEREVLKQRESELRVFYSYLIDMYGN